MSAAADEAFRIAQQHHLAGRLAEAEDQYRHALAADSRHAGALHGMGALALAADEPKMAEKLIRGAIAVRGEWAEGCYHLGVALAAQEQFDGAIAAYRRAAALNSSLFDAHYQLAVCLQLSGQRDKAIAAYRQAILLRANDPVALTNFAVALQSAGQLDEAIEMLRRATAAKPDFGDAFVPLGNALRARGKSEEAIAALVRACELKPTSWAAWSELAAAYREMGLIDSAIAAQRRVLALRPEDAEGNWALANLLLLHGDLAEGLGLLDWRWKRKMLPWPRRRFDQPMWDGGELAGRTIYLHGEQSNADTIHFARYIPIVAARGGKVIVECQPGLRRLLANSFPGIVSAWFSPGEPAPAFDVVCPLISLPRLLGVLPGEVPYLRATRESAEAWGKKLADHRDVIKVGLVWTGSPSEIENRNRSVTLADFAPLSEITGARFFSLQKAGLPAAGFSVVDYTSEFADFADTAGLVSELDLVISVDTAVAHLSAAMGKPTWTLLQFVPHWRWGIRGKTTAWYPTMRLFRQAARGEWSDPIHRIGDALRQLATPFNR